MCFNSHSGKTVGRLIAEEVHEAHDKEYQQPLPIACATSANALVKRCTCIQRVTGMRTGDTAVFPERTMHRFADFSLSEHSLHNL